MASCRSLCRSLSVWAAFVLTANATAQDVGLLQVLDRADAYLAAYYEQLSTVIADEHYDQAFYRGNDKPLPTGSTRTIMAHTRPTSRRRLESEFLLMRGPSSPDPWLGFRDVIEVDGRTLVDRKGRLERLVREAGPDLRVQAMAFSRENARYNLGDVFRTINVPFLALEFARASNGSRVRYKKTGSTTIEGVSTWTIDYKEHASTTIIRSEKNQNVPAAGTFWIDPASGRIVRTTLETGATATAAVRTRIVVSYGPDDKLGMWVPRAMDEKYTKPDGEIVGTARYDNYRRFETAGRLIERRPLR